MFLKKIGFIETIITIGIVGIALIIGIGYKFINKKAPDDNPVEELAEALIKERTGIDIDLTPDSPEK